MKQIAFLSLKIFALSLVLTCAALPAWAQNGKLEISGLDHLAAKASETVDVNMDEHLLQMTAKFLGKDPDEAKIKEIIAGLKGIYVKNFSFDNEGDYTAGDIEAIRSQLRGPGWTKFIQVHSRRDGDNVEVYILTLGDQIQSLAILDFEPKELTVVNIVGPVDIDKLSQLEGQFGIPDMDLDVERSNKPQPKKQ
ncbi:MAG TPA: DUF4252 domain-containing protein [Pyrinomonadaceae bacterium]|jgi:hypothetical protein|nr:DUF4252 domain-containing protein [Pyrinomonadaceae bacterium]